MAENDDSIIEGDDLGLMGDIDDELGDLEDILNELEVYEDKGTTEGRKEVPQPSGSKKNSALQAAMRQVFAPLGHAMISYLRS